MSGWASHFWNGSELMSNTPAPVTIWHNPRCGTSRNTLALIRNAGIEPEIVDYLKTPPDRDTLRSVIQASGGSVRNLVRSKEAIYAELDLANADDARLIEAMLAHPILINRPVVISALGTRLCRPSEEVLDILPAPQRGAFSKEDGEAVVDARGRRLR